MVQDAPVPGWLGFAELFRKVFLSQECDRESVDMPFAEWGSVGPILNRASGKVHPGPPGCLFPGLFCAVQWFCF